MKVVRYIVGAISFVLVWFVVAAVIGFVVNWMFPLPEGRAPGAAAHRWRQLPGTLLGLLAATQSFRASIRDPAHRDHKSDDGHIPQTAGRDAQTRE